MERLLGGALLLLLAVLVVRWAVEVLLSILWPLVIIAGLCLLFIVAWRLWRAGRDRW
jgi:hypothetical protein